jgi:hypothetical protein
VDLVLASSMKVTPGAGRSGGLVDLFIVVGVVALIAVCLFLLFRRGSIADRARREAADDNEPSADSP